MVTTYDKLWLFSTKELDGYTSTYNLQYEGDEYVDVANYLGVTKPSVSVAINNLKKAGFLDINEDGMILLTAEGKERAQMVYDKYCFWIDVFEKFGLDSKTAEDEACKVEHALSDEAFLQIKHAITQEDELYPRSGHLTVINKYRTAPVSSVKNEASVLPPAGISDSLPYRRVRITQHPPGYSLFRAAVPVRKIRF